MDLVDVCAQALVYEREGRYPKDSTDAEHETPNAGTYDALDEFFATARPRLCTETGRELFVALERRYERAKRTSGSDR